MQMEQQAGYKLSADAPQMTYAQSVMRTAVPHSEEHLLLKATAALTSTTTQQKQQQEEWEVYDESLFAASGVAHNVAELSQCSEQRQLVEQWTFIAPSKKQQQSTQANTDTATTTAATTAATAASTTDASGSHWYSVDGTEGSAYVQMRGSGNTDVAPRVPATQLRSSQYCSVRNPYSVFTSNNSNSSGSSGSSD
jgi:hypothetical protein